MKLPLAICTATLLALPAMAQAETSVQLKHFQNLPALREWAVEGTFGGGSLDLLSDDGREIAIANRMYTSGVTSSGVTVFVKRPSGWDEALNLGPYWLDSVTFKQTGDTVILKLAASGQELLRFSIKGMHRQYEDPGMRSQ